MVCVVEVALLNTCGSQLTRHDPGKQARFFSPVVRVGNVAATGDQLVLGVAGHFAQCMVDTQPHTVAANQSHFHRRFFKRQPEACHTTGFGQPSQSLFGRFARCDVNVHASHAHTRRPYSSAADLVNAITPALAAAHHAACGTPRRPLTDRQYYSTTVCSDTRVTWNSSTFGAWPASPFCEAASADNWIGRCVGVCRR
jgi:hypothetical protein